MNDYEFFFFLSITTVLTEARELRGQVISFKPYGKLVFNGLAQTLL